MPDKLTDSEIVKALECVIECNNGLKKHCIGCLLKKHYPYCEEKVIENALDLINRLQAIVEKAEKVEHFADKTIATLQAENERLKKENKLLINNDVSNKYPNCVLVEKGRIYTRTLEDYDELIGDISTEAYTDFAESLKKDFDNPHIQKFGLDFVKFLKKLVDNKLQEMKGND